MQTSVSASSSAPARPTALSEGAPSAGVLTAGAEPLPLSSAQQRLWFIHELDGNAPVYNVPLAVRLRGSLNTDALSVALNQIVQRHEALRTNFVRVAGAPAQVVQQHRQLELRLIDGPADSNELQQVLRREVRRPFDLTSDMLVRATLFRRSDRDYVLVLNLHHIICDEWSLELLLSELSQLYTGLARGPAGSLPDLPIQYADYALWQREWLTSPELQEHLQYWRKRLNGELPRLEWPPRESEVNPPPPAHEGRRQTIRLPAGLSAALHQLGRRERATLFMTLLAAFKVLLHRYTGQETITVGSPIAGRGRVETENLIGFFVNTLVLRTELSGDPSFVELLRRVRSTTLGAYDHQELPFEKLVEDLRPEREFGHTPWVQAMFALEHAPKPVAMPGLEVELLEVDTGTAKFDLTWVLRESETGIETCVEYPVGLFDDATITRMLGHWQTLLEAVVEQPERALSRLPLIGPGERRRAIVEWNDTARPYPDHASVAALFEAQAQARPAAIAVRYGPDELTYAALNQRADQIARRLRQHGVGPEVLVGLCAEPCTELIAGMLGILKAGGAYVPLDPGYPRERLQLMLEDTAAPVVLTQIHLQSRLPPTSATVISLETVAAGSAAGAPASVEITGSHTAYVIYTSGSTGRPKGVMIPHRGITRLALNTDYVQLTPADRVAQASSATFDAATFEIWGALLNGATLIGIPREIALSPASLANALASERITTLFLTTALFNQVAAAAPGAFGGLKQLLFGGEAVDPKWVAKVLQARPPERLLHVYGPTETTTFATWFKIVEVSARAATIPIGRPIANTRVYILDSNLQPSPIGVPGEIYIGGPGVAKGYLNAPELTADKFVPDPFTREAGARLYRTGDRARYRADGNVEFLGRLDYQVKVRGFRVELGEIELALLRHPAVREAVVLARDGDSSLGKSLAAYVVFKDGAAQTSLKDLQDHLKQTLPQYMAPASITPLATLPLNAHGKIDRAQLPTPQAALLRSDDGFVAPRTPAEEKLAALWREALGIPQVGMHDNFFDLGGHSLLAVRLFAAIENTFGRKLPLASLFRSPTVAQLAAVIQKEETSSAWPLIVDIQPQGSKPPIYWMHSLGGDGGGAFFYYRKLAELLGSDQPSFGVRSPQEPFTSVEQMASRYVDELLRSQPEGPYFLGGFCFGGIVAYEMARQLHERGREVGLLVLLESAPPRPEGARTRWSIAAIGCLARNIQSWVGDVFERPRDVWARLQRKAKVIQAKLQRRFAPGATQGASDRADIGNFIDMAEYPKDYIRYARAHWQALQSYRPRAYRGRITLFRARKQPLLSVDPTLGWGDLAPARVDVNVIPGTHEKMLEEPNVLVLAAELKRRLLEAQSECCGTDPAPLTNVSNYDSAVVSSCSCSMIT